MHLLPSEVARLVLGYLKEKCLKKTFVAFLQESPDLSEYWRMLNSGETPTTSVMGLTLQNILEEHTALSIKVKALTSQLAQLSNSPNPLSRVSQEYVRPAVTLEQSDINAVLESHRKAEVEKNRRNARQKSRRRNSGSHGLKSSERNVPSSSQAASRHQVESTVTSNSSSCSKALPQESNQVDKSSEVEDLDDEFEFDSLDRLLADTKLHEKLAESINKALKRDQGTSSSDHQNTPSDTAKRKQTDHGQILHIKESVQKSASSGVAQENIEDIISMTADEPGLEQLLSLFQFQPEVTPQNVSASSNVNDINDHTPHSSADLYIPPIGSKSVLSDSSHHPHQKATPHQAAAVQNPLIKSCDDIADTQISRPSMSEVCSSTPNVSNPNVTSTGTITVCHSNNGNLQSFPAQATHSLDKSCDNNNVNSFEVNQNFEKDAAKSTSSLLPCHQSVILTPPPRDPPTQSGLSNNERISKKSRIKRIPKKISQNSSKDGVKCRKTNEKKNRTETSVEKDKVIKQNCENLAKGAADSNFIMQDETKVDESDCFSKIGSQPQDKEYGTSEGCQRGIDGVKNQERNSEFGSDTHCLKASSSENEGLGKEIDNSDVRKEKEDDIIKTKAKDTNGGRSAKIVDTWERNGNGDVGLSKDYRKAVSCDESSQLETVADSHPVSLSSSVQTFSSNPLHKSSPIEYTQNKDIFPSGYDQKEASISPIENQPSHKASTAPKYGMEENSLSLFSFLERNAAALTAENFSEELDNEGCVNKDTVETIDNHEESVIDIKENQTDKDHLASHTGENIVNRESEKKVISEKSASEIVEPQESRTEKIECDKICEKNPPDNVQSDENGKVKVELIGDTSVAKVPSSHNSLPTSTAQIPMCNVGVNFDSDSSFDRQLSTPDAVFVKPLCLSNSRLERNFHMVDTCLQNILGELKVSGSETERLSNVKIETNDDHICPKGEESGTVNDDNAALTEDIDSCVSDKKEEIEEMSCAKDNSESESEKDITRIAKRKKSIHLDEIEHLHNCSATISTPFVTENVDGKDDSPRKLAGTQLRNNECVSMPASLPSLMKEKVKSEIKCKSGDNCPTFSPSSSKFKSQTKRNFAPVTPPSIKCNRKVIAYDIAHSPFIPSHCKQKAPSRRITPMEVSFSTPSPLQVLSPSSPADFIIDLAHSPSQPNTPATREVIASPGNDPTENTEHVYVKSKRQSKAGVETGEQFVSSKLTKDRDKMRKTNSDIESGEEPISSHSVNKNVFNEVVRKELFSNVTTQEKHDKKLEESHKVVEQNRELENVSHERNVRKKISLSESDKEKLILKEVAGGSSQHSSGECVNNSSDQLGENEQLHEVGAATKKDSLSALKPLSTDSQLSDLRDDTSDVTLPSSPSRRKPRRIVPTLLSSTVSKGGGDSFLSPSSCSPNGAMFCQDESKIVSSTSDPSSPHSEEEAFRLLKTIYQSYSKPQPNQEITSSNAVGRPQPSSAMQKCGCLSREVCTHIKGKGRKISKKHGVSYAKGKDRESPLKKSTSNKPESKRKECNSNLAADIIICDSSSKDDINSHEKDIVLKVFDSNSSEAFVPVGFVDLKDNENLKDSEIGQSQQENSEKTKNLSDAFNQQTEKIDLFEQISSEKLVSSASTDILQSNTKQIDSKDMDENNFEKENKSSTASNEKLGSNAVTHDCNNSQISNENKTSNQSPITKSSDQPTLEFEDHHENISLAAPYFPELSNTMDFFKLKKQRNNETVAPEQSAIWDEKLEIEILKSKESVEFNPQFETLILSDLALGEKEPPPPSEGNCLLTQAMKECGIPLEPSDLSLIDNSQFASFSSSPHKSDNNMVVNFIGGENLSVTDEIQEPQRTQGSAQLRRSLRNIKNIYNKSNISKNAEKTKSLTPAAADYHQSVVPSSNSSSSPFELLLNPLSLAGKVAYFRQPNQPPVPFVILSDGKLVVLPDTYNSILPPPPSGPPGHVQSVPPATLPAVAFAPCVSQPQPLCVPQPQLSCLLQPDPPSVLPAPTRVPIPPAVPSVSLPPAPPPLYTVPRSRSQKSVCQPGPPQIKSKLKNKNSLSSTYKNKDSKPKNTTGSSFGSLQKMAVRRKIGENDSSPQKPSVSTYFKKPKRNSAMRMLTLSRKNSPPLKNDVEKCQKPTKSSLEHPKEATEMDNDTADESNFLANFFVDEAESDRNYENEVSNPPTSSEVLRETCTTKKLEKASEREENDIVETEGITSQKEDELFDGDSPETLLKRNGNEFLEKENIRSDEKSPEKVNDSRIAKKLESKSENGDHVEKETSQGISQIVSVTAEVYKSFDDERDDLYENLSEEKEKMLTSLSLKKTQSLNKSETSERIENASQISSVIDGKGKENIWANGKDTLEDKTAFEETNISCKKTGSDFTTERSLGNVKDLIEIPVSEEQNKYVETVIKEKQRSDEDFSFISPVKSSIQNSKDSHSSKRKSFSEIIRGVSPYTSYQSKFSPQKYKSRSRNKSSDSRDSSPVKTRPRRRKRIMSSDSRDSSPVKTRPSRRKRVNSSDSRDSSPVETRPSRGERIKSSDSSYSSPVKTRPSRRKRNKIEVSSSDSDSSFETDLSFEPLLSLAKIVKDKDVTVTVSHEGAVIKDVSNNTVFVNFEKRTRNRNSNSNVEKEREVSLADDKRHRKKLNEDISKDENTSVERKDESVKEDFEDIGDAKSDEIIPQPRSDDCKDELKIMKGNKKRKAETGCFKEETKRSRTEMEAEEVAAEPSHGKRGKYLDRINKVNTKWSSAKQQRNLFDEIAAAASSENGTEVDKMSNMDSILKDQETDKTPNLGCVQKGMEIDKTSNLEGLQEDKEIEKALNRDNILKNEKRKKTLHLQKVLEKDKTSNIDSLQKDKEIDKTSNVDRKQKQRETVKTSNMDSTQKDKETVKTSNMDSMQKDKETVKTSMDNTQKDKETVKTSNMDSMQKDKETVKTSNMDSTQKDKETVKTSNMDSVQKDKETVKTSNMDSMQKDKETVKTSMDNTQKDKETVKTSNMDSMQKDKETVKTSNMDSTQKDKETVKTSNMDSMQKDKETVKTSNMDRIQKHEETVKTSSRDIIQKDPKRKKTLRLQKVREKDKTSNMNIVQKDKERDKASNGGSTQKDKETVTVETSIMDTVQKEKDINKTPNIEILQLQRDKPLNMDSLQKDKVTEKKSNVEEVNCNRDEKIKGVKLSRNPPDFSVADSKAQVTDLSPNGSVVISSSKLKRLSSPPLVDAPKSALTYPPKKEEQFPSLNSSGEMTMFSSQTPRSLPSPSVQKSHPANSTQDTPVSTSQQSAGSSTKSITKRKIDKLLSKLYKTPPSSGS